MIDEDKRLDMMMEIERLNALKIQEEIEQQRHHQAKEYLFIFSISRKKNMCIYIFFNYLIEVQV